MGPLGLELHASFLFFLRFASLAWMLLLSSIDAATDNNDENALLAWKQELPSSLQWSDNDPCGSKWTGITCDKSTPRRVIYIELAARGLGGTLPPDIGSLTALRTFDISNNNFTGSLPIQLGDLISLDFLDLQSNYFTGRIPAELGQLRNLSHLSLNNNQLRGPIPNELGLLDKLYWLDLSFNSLQGQLPYSSDGNHVNAGLDNLTSAAHFHLNNNNLEGPIPSPLCHLGMSLLHLLLDTNKLTDTIPKQLGNCSSLEILKLNNNNLRGAVPPEIGQLASLSQLQLGGNHLSSLPNLSSLSKLMLLDLSNNSFEESFPDWLPLLDSLTTLNMQKMPTHGQIPGTLFGLGSLNTVRLDNNQINGTLDLSGSSNQLRLVSLENNEITRFTQGQYSPVLQLQGNPICNGSTTLSAAVCSDAPPNPVTYENSTCPPSTTCPSEHLVNPLDCSCGIPFQGLLIFRSPSFTALNDTLLAGIISVMARLLSLNTNQITAPSTSFNTQNQLFIRVQMFPVGDHWNSDSRSRMTDLLLHNLSLPGSFGPPPTFQSDAYPDEPNSSSSALSEGVKIGIAVGGVVVLLIIAAVCLFALLQKRRADKATELSKPFASWGGSKGDSGGAPKLKGARRFSYAELKKATENFSESNELGSGGYGKVYKGILVGGEQVAIKRAQKGSMQGASEFKTEIELLSRVHHKNVVGLAGFCCEQGEEMLVYEYMPNGTLRENLLGKMGVTLDWHRRLMIALGAARGLMYLHELASPPIIHRDIKSTNILLDEKKVAKVADFGLSKIGTGEESGKQHVSTQVKGTLGYLDPEYYLSQQLTEKSDVYSYGVVLLELLTARAPIERGKYVVKEVKGAVEGNGLIGLRSMLDPRIRNDALPELNTFVNIALSCVEELAVNRPTMSEVVKQLEELIGQDYPESGSSTVDVGMGKQRSHPYTSDSELIHTSGDSSYPSFPNSGSQIPPSFGSR